MLTSDNLDLGGNQGRFQVYEPKQYVSEVPVCRAATVVLLSCTVHACFCLIISAFPGKAQSS